MTNHNIFADPQATMSVLCRPPDGFETLYQGLARSTPLPFVPVRYQSGLPKFDALDPTAGEASTEISEFLSRFIPSPIGATMMVLIPRARYFDDIPLEGTYSYELRWRLRTVNDHNQMVEGRGDPAMPYNLITQRGAPDGSTPLTQIPAWTSEVIVPATVGAGDLPVVAPPTQRGYAGQGLFVPDSVGGDGNAYAPNNYNRFLRRVEGNELSIVGYRTSGDATWDFSGDDAGISNLFGTNLGGTGSSVEHPVFTGVGLYVVFMVPSPAL